MHIELLVVPDCPHEAAAAELITTAVADTGVRATITHTIIASEDRARQRGFVGSPTILLNGSDPFAPPGAPIALACRLYSTPDGLHGVPGLRDLRQALKRVAAR
jgi:glutaredoxin